jgi:hypothetical protein
MQLTVQIIKTKKRLVQAVYNISILSYDILYIVQYAVSIKGERYNLELMGYWEIRAV